MQIKIICTDGHEIVVSDAVVKHAEFVTTKAKEATSKAEPIPVKVKVPGPMMRKILVWLEYYKDQPLTPARQRRKEKEKPNRRIAVPPYDREFLKVPRNDLYEMANCAYELQVYLLVQSIAMTIAEQIRGKTTEQMRVILGFEDEEPDPFKPGPSKPTVESDDDDDDL